MEVGFAGDWHGSGNAARHVLHSFARRGIDTVFHVGDFGIGWPGLGEEYAAAVDWLLQKLDITLYVTPGNHENWDYVDSLPYHNGQAWVGQRLAVLRKHTRFDLDGRQFLSLGGAPSIDFPDRMEGLSWWRNECLTMSDVYRVENATLDSVPTPPTDVMIAHDAPDNSTDEVGKIVNSSSNPWTKEGLAYAREGRLLMNAIVEVVQPKVFVHGHYHVKGEKQVGGTQYLSLADDQRRRALPQGNALVLDVPSLTHEWLDIQQAPW